MRAKWLPPVVAALSVAIGVGYGATAAPAANDWQAPSVSFTAPASGAVVNRTLGIAGTASDNVAVSRVDVRIGSGTWTRASGTTSWSLSVNTRVYSNGTHSLYARATDLSGNQRTVSRSVTFNNDFVVPAVAVTSPAAGATLAGVVTTSGDASDNVRVARIEVRVDSGPYQLAVGTTAWTYSLDTRPYANGSHTLTVRATDAAGNQASATRSVTFNNDFVVPAVAVTSPAAGATLAGVVTMSGTASDNVGVARVEVQVDSGPYQLAVGTTAWTYSLDTRQYANGSHTLTARATDPAGNQASVTRSVTFQGDAVVPTVTVTSPAAGATLAGLVTMSGTASDNVSVARVEVQVDSGPYQLAVGTTAWTYSLDTRQYANGSHTLTARATDPAGNQASATRSVTFQGDAVVPTVTVTSPAEGATVAGPVTVSGTASDNVAVARVEVRVDSNPYQLAVGTTAWTYSLNTAPYANGSHTLTARAKAPNLSGNQRWAVRTVTNSTWTPRLPPFRS